MLQSNISTYINFIPFIIWLVLTAFTFPSLPIQSVQVDHIVPQPTLVAMLANFGEFGNTTLALTWPATVRHVSDYCIKREVFRVEILSDVFTTNDPHCHGNDTGCCHVVVVVVKISINNKLELH